MNSRIEILLVEDNPGDVRLTLEAFKEGKVINNLTVVNDGVDALAYLRREGRYAEATVPDLILLDLNLPKMDGRQVLAAIKPMKADDHSRRRVDDVGVTGRITRATDTMQTVTSPSQSISIRTSGWSSRSKASGCRS